MTAVAERERVVYWKRNHDTDIVTLRIIDADGMERIEQVSDDPKRGFAALDRVWEILGPETHSTHADENGWYRMTACRCCENTTVYWRSINLDEGLVESQIVGPHGSEEIE